MRSILRHESVVLFVFLLLCGGFYSETAVAAEEEDERQRVTTIFQMNDAEGERLTEAGVRYRGLLGDNWELSGEMMAGHHRSSSEGFQGEVLYGHVAITSKHFEDWSITIGPGFGASPERNTPSLIFGLDYEPSDQLRVSLDIDYRTLWTSFPIAVAIGALRDKAKISVAYQPLKRLIFKGNYSFERYYLPSGGEGLEHAVNPSLELVILKKPYLTLGYEFYFSNLTERNDFFATLPLLPRFTTHYLTGFLSHDFHPRFYWEGYFFFGEDTAQNLHLLKGDLFGLGTRFIWKILRWLDLDVSYDFQKATINNFTGKDRLVTVELSGHW